MSQKSTAISILGGGVGGFFLGGPIGALFGAGLGYVVSRFYGGGGSSSGDLPGEDAVGDWSIMPVEKGKEPGDYKWFDKLAQTVIEGQKKPSITFKIVNMKKSEFLTAKGNAFKVWVEPIGEQMSMRFWLVEQTSDFTALDPSGADGLPPPGTVWRLYDGQIVSGDNSGT